MAIKVVEHSNAAGKVDIIEGARESLLAASVSHPNIIVRMTGPTGRSSPAWLCPAQHHARCSSEPVGSCCHMLCSRAVLTHISVCVQRRMPAAEPAGNSMCHACRIVHHQAHEIAICMRVTLLFYSSFKDLYIYIYI